jgi:hypothetical protein
MVDNVNPTSQFHPYQPQDATPVADRQKTGGLGGILSGLGIDRSKLGSSMKNIDLSKARTYARNNGGLVLGGLAALAIGAGLMRGRR